MREKKVCIDYVTGSRRLKALRDEKELSHQKLSEITEINKQSLINYERAGKEDGSEYATRADAFGGMSVNNAVALAKTFGVSTDYLLGLSDVKSPDADIQAICTYTGLSEKAVKQLHENQNSLDPECKKGAGAISALLENKTGRQTLNNLYNYLFTEITGFSVPDKESPKHELVGSVIGICENEKTLYDLDASLISGVFLSNIQQGLTRLKDRIKKGGGK